VVRRVWNKEHGPGEHIDNPSESHENQRCKHNNRNRDADVAATRDVLACRVGLATPRQGNSHARTTMRVVSAVLLLRRHYAIDDTPARRGRVRPLGMVDASGLRTM